MTQISWTLQNFGQILKTCIAERDVLRGKSLHALSLKSLFPHSTYFSNHLIAFYSKFGLLSESRRVFDQTQNPNVFTFNAIVAAYAKASKSQIARQMFEVIPQKDSVSYNTLISSYAKSGDAVEALRLFRAMREANIATDEFSLSSAIMAFGGDEDFGSVRQLHSLAISGGFDRYTIVNNSLITCYGKLRALCDAERVFWVMGDSVRDEASWHTMITAYVKSRDESRAVKFLREMICGGLRIDVFTLASVLTVLKSFSVGVQFHAKLIRLGFNLSSCVGSRLLDLYSKFPSGALCFEKIFAEVVSPDLILWNKVISGYSQRVEYSEAAIDCFCAMRRFGHHPDESSFTGAISACSNLASPSQGTQIHSLAIKSYFGSGGRISVHNTLVRMYSRCGNLPDARKVFDEMPERNTVTLNSMIAAYARHGFGSESVRLFEKMVGEHKIVPSVITFVSVLSACAHAGMVDEGRKYFDVMRDEFGIEPVSEHYSCMIDLLGRAGKLGEAEEFVDSMPFEPSFSGWASLLGACNRHGNLKMALKASNRLIQLEPSNALPYIVLAGMYSRAGKWDEMAEIRKVMRDRGAIKTPGFSSIEVDMRVHYFVAEDISHPMIREIHAYLAEMMTRIGRAGYIMDPKGTTVKEDEAVEGETKTRLGHHSEKLAVAFGLVSTREGQPILVVKNLRICGDCHNFVKFVSAVTGREITVRDKHRFHCFKDGHCSCGDFW